jgi:hypothetical protein
MQILKESFGIDYTTENNNNIKKDSIQ